MRNVPQTAPLCSLGLGLLLLGCTLEHAETTTTIEVQDYGYALIEVSSPGQRNRATFSASNAPSGSYKLFWSPTRPTPQVYAGVPDTFPSCETTHLCDLDTWGACREPLDCELAPGAGYLVAKADAAEGNAVLLEHTFGPLTDSDEPTSFSADLSYYYVVTVELGNESSMMPSFALGIESANYDSGASKATVMQLL